MSLTFLETADRIGARLCRDAIWAGQRCNWLGGYGDDPSAIVHCALDHYLYQGSSGIALFLFQLGAATGEKVFRITAEGALRRTLSKLGDVRAWRLGFYDGLAGIAYVAARAAEITGDEAHASEALRLAHELDADRARIDVINGSAGVIAALLYLHRLRRGDFLLELAIRHGQRLVDRANRSDAGWSWTTADRQSRDLTGFAHGAAGIAWALLELFQITQEEKFRCAAAEAFRYEQSVYRSEEENWPDFRRPSGVDPDGNATFECALAWCHGAPGIGLSRLRAWQILGQEIHRGEALAAIRTTSKSVGDLGEGSYSLCHGHAGNAELLLYAGQVLEDREYLSLAEKVGETGIEKYEKEKVPWPCGVPGGDETPDLMIGLAGIGYFYLRLHDALASPPILIVVPE